MLLHAIGCVSSSICRAYPGHYVVGVWVGSHNTQPLDAISECVGFEIDASPTPNRTFPHEASAGYVVPHARLEYEMLSLPSESATVAAAANATALSTNSSERFVASDAF
jgi:hypothetical protein